jgi:uncharacterized protein (TIGR02594 family)
MAGKKKETPFVEPPTPWMKDDEIRVDTSQAPWMDVAKEELGKDIRELPADDELINSMRRAVAADALQRRVAQEIKDFGTQSPLLGTKPGASDPGRFRLTTRELPDAADRALGMMEASRLVDRNPKIMKYFTDIKTDPIYDKKGRSFDMAPTYESNGRGFITAWCAAFVNWCLTKAGAPHLGYATAKSWVDFGTPVAHPVYGCVTVIKPSSSTGSTTGHVAFFVERQGGFVKLLGGNQGDKVCETLFNSASVLAYRWPTSINQYLAARTGVLT